MSRDFAASTSGGLGNGTRFGNCALSASTAVAASPRTISSRQPQAIAGRSPSFSPAAATISGDGVSPAASAAASGSPPGNAAAICRAEAGRFAGFFSRQRSITRSTRGSMSFKCADGAVGALFSRSRAISSYVAASYGFFPVNISYITKPRE